MNLYKFDITSAKKFISKINQSYSFATVCPKENSDFLLDVEKALYISFQKHSKEDYNDIIAQSLLWKVKIIKTEEWDPSIYDIGKTIKEEYHDINPEIILVKDGKFIGVIDYTNYGEEYEITCVFTDEFQGKPILFKTVSGFGSSDHDMMYTTKYYLTKNNC